jgi:predicted hotdog family 3-hydroxylacyl-ACP dehydratase
MTALDRSRIARLIPHSGTMCLLDEVERWDANSIRCRTGRHRRPDNPLVRAEGGIGGICAVELAAQAMAVHGRLAGAANAPPKPGALASVRDVRLRATMLDRVEDDIVIDAVLLMSDGASATYSFTVCAAESEIARGRATVVFDIGLS